MELLTKCFSDLSKEELYEILRLRAAVFVVEQDCPYQDLDDLDSEAVFVYYKEDNRILAGLRILARGVYFDTVTISRVVTDPAFRSKGLAAGILTEALSYVTSRMQESRVKIAAQAHLAAFYGQFGFFPLSEDTYILDGIPHVDMEVNLPPCPS